jgi:magnesium-transporting ATPase (P-type)
MPKVRLLHSLSVKLHRPDRHIGHPLSDQDNFELFPEIFGRWTFFRATVLQVSGYPLSQACHKEYSDWTQYCHSNFSSQLLFLQKYGKRVVFQNMVIKWVAMAFVIATPITYYAMHKWLENFAYKTDLSWWIFALAGLLALGIALITVTFQSYKAASKNPIESLRYE